MENVFFEERKIEQKIERVLEKGGKKMSIFSGKIIVVVDDDEIMRRLWENTFFLAASAVEKEGEEILEIFTYEDGLAASIAVVEADIEPDLLITDLEMPGVDGLKLSKIVRQKFPEIKILMITGSRRVSLAKEAKEAGVDKVLRKPVSMKEFIETVIKLLKEKEEERNG